MACSSRDIEVATTIRDQIFTMNPIVAMSWGMHSPAVIPSTTQHMGGLSFRVNGAKVKGRVAVYLDFSDTYTLAVHVGNSPDAKHVMRDVYAFDLNKLIDEIVET